MDLAVSIRKQAIMSLTDLALKHDDKDHKLLHW